VEAGSAQESISLWEKPGYGRLTLSTLIRLASAFDVGLMVRFVPYSELVDRAARALQGNIATPSYAADTRLHSADDTVVHDAISTGYLASTIGTRVCQPHPVATHTGEDVTLQKTEAAA
jgi:hypothetical protein